MHCAQHHYLYKRKNSPAGCHIIADIFLWRSTALSTCFGWTAVGTRVAVTALSSYAARHNSSRLAVGYYDGQVLLLALTDNRDPEDTYIQSADLVLHVSSDDRMNGG